MPDDDDYADEEEASLIAQQEKFFLGKPTKHQPVPRKSGSLFQQSLKAGLIKPSKTLPPRRITESEKKDLVTPFILDTSSPSSNPLKGEDVASSANMDNKTLKEKLANGNNEEEEEKTELSELKKEIQLENTALLKEMTLEDVEQARVDLYQQFDKELLDKLKVIPLPLINL